jgi:hypothetical protein
LIHGYALMTNHYHLMVESVYGNLSKAMAYLNGNYTQRVNQERGIDGSIFRGRFRNKVVTDPGHWRYLLTYLHLNPVKAKLVMRIDQWHWTSHNYYSGKGVAPEWFTTEDFLTEFEGVEGYRRYLKEVRQGRRESPEGFDLVLHGGQRSSEMPIVKQDESARDLEPEHALEQVQEVSGIGSDEIFREVRGRGGNPVRTVAAWWLVIGAGLSNGEAGRLLKMSPVAVSRAISRVRMESKRNPTGDIAERADNLKEKQEKVASRGA